MNISFILFSVLLILGPHANSASGDKELISTAKALFGIIPAKTPAPDKVSAEQA